MPIRTYAQPLKALLQGPIARSSMASLALRIATLGFGFVQAVLTARLLGAEGYGIVALSISVAVLAATFAVLGFGAFGVTEVPRLLVAKDYPGLRGFLRFSLIATVLTSSAIALVLAALALGTDLMSPAFRSTLIIAPVLIPLFVILAWAKGVAQGFGNVIVAQAPTELLRPVVMTVLLAVLMLGAYPLGSVGYMALAIASAFIACAVSAGLLLRIIAADVPQAEPRAEPRQWLLGTTPFLMISLLGIFLAEVNTLLLGWLAGPRETGLYQPVARLGPLIMIGMQAVAMRYSPKVSELWARGDAAGLIHITNRVTLATTAVAVVMAFAMLAIAPIILGAFGKEFGASLPALWWIIVAQVVNAACGPVGILLSMTRKTNLMLIGQSVALVVNIALGLWLIPRFGAVGAAQAFAAGVVVWNLVLLVGVRRALGFDPSLPASARRMLAARRENG